VTDSLKLWAFWNYDLFPFLCNGRVNQVATHGSVEIVNIPGCFYHPRFLLPADEGKKLSAELDKLEGEQRSAVDAVKRTYVKKLNELLSKYGLEPRINDEG